MSWSKYLLRSLAHDVRNRLLSGLLVLIPLGISLFVLSLFLKATAGILMPLMTMLLGDLPKGVVFLLSVVVVFGVLYLAGMLASFVVGRKLIGVGERLVDQIPIVKTIYSVSKQVIQLFQTPSSGARRQVALVDFPAPGLKAISFVTGIITLPDGTVCYKVFIPTTPNPTTGFLQMVPVATAQLLDLSVEDAITLIMSGGVLAPDALAGVRNSDASDAP